MALLKKGECRLHLLLGDMSPAAFAEKMNVYESTVSRWMNNKTEMSYENIIVASRIFGCHPEMIYELIDQPRKIIKKR